jgi:ATP-dependent DNA ligase
MSFTRSRRPDSHASAGPPADPAAWQPMAFGGLDSSRIHNAICEPLWAGQRVLVHVTDAGVTIRDEDADELEGFDALRQALEQSMLALDLVVDGYLVPGSLGSEPVGIAPADLDPSLTARDLTRQFFFGGGGTMNKRREALALARERDVVLPPDLDATFVAIDLLRLDGQPLLDLPLLERKRLLESAIRQSELVRLTMSVRPPVELWYAQWKALGIRMFAVKDANSRYKPGGVSRDWTTAAIPRR